MKRTGLAALLMALCLLLCGCRAASFALNDADAPLSGTAVPEASADETMLEESKMVLYFRYYNEPYLAAELRSVSVGPTEARETALVRELLKGPDARDTWLTVLFPEGTKLVSTLRQGRTLFVTFSRELMNGYADEPSNWRNQPEWQKEAPLRRRLCMQSLTATLTENCDVDRVQVLVEQSSANAIGSLRLRQSWYLDTEDENLLSGPLTRDESLLLTPAGTLRALLDLWISCDWQHMVLYVKTSMSQEDFAKTMAALPAVKQAEFSGGSLSSDGNTATFTLNMVTSAGKVEDVVIRLTRSSGLWRVNAERLQEVVTP